MLHRYLQSEIAKLHRERVRPRFIGARGRLPADTVSLLEDVESRTAGNGRLTLTVALSYGGRQEIVAAARRLAEAAAGRLGPEAIDERRFAAELFTVGIPDPDLVIRTSGEQRISSFLPWQSACSEFLFLDTLGPDFSREHLVKAVEDFRKRDRHYGMALGSG